MSLLSGCKQEAILVQTLEAGVSTLNYQKLISSIACRAVFAGLQAAQLPAPVAHMAAEHVRVPRRAHHARLHNCLHRAARSHAAVGQVLAPRGTVFMFEQGDPDTYQCNHPSLYAVSQLPAIQLHF